MIGIGVPLVWAALLTAPPWFDGACVPDFPVVWAPTLVWTLATALTKAPWLVGCGRSAAPAEMRPDARINAAAMPSTIDFVTRITIASPRKDSPRDIKRASLTQECSDVERLGEKKDRRWGSPRFLFLSIIALFPVHRFPFVPALAATPSTLSVAPYLAP